MLGGINTPYVLQDQGFQSGNKSTNRKKKSSKSRYMTATGEIPEGEEEVYDCSRKFCSFCLKTNYEENFSHCYNSKQWICPFCQGVCFCTRCLRQDTMTQLKAYFIALGGELSCLQNSNSIFDKIIFQNFQTHLMLTLLSNANLTQMYPHYAYFMGMVPTP